MNESGHTALDLSSTRSSLITHVIALFFCFSLIAQSVFSQENVTPSDTIGTAALTVAPASSLLARDYKYDDGESIELSWVPSIDDRTEDGGVIGYQVFRSADGEEPTMLAELPSGSNHYRDENTELGISYVYHVVTLGTNSQAKSIPTASISPEREWMNFKLKYLFLIALIIGGAVIYFIETARRGKSLFVRKIAVLEAIDEAIGRSTEMGRPILFIPGIQDMDDVQTLAGITILGRVSRTIADYDTKIAMPVSRSLVMTAARETIKASYMAAGRPDAYSDDMVNYVTDEQFSYVAAVDGLMVREKPAACFYLGAFFAESLIVAETGNSIGAIQIAGTAMPAQLPFFVAACDFTLIGEELFAASAYLSGEPKQLGSLKGQDVGKGLAMIVIVIGIIAATGAAMSDAGWWNDVVTSLKTLLNTTGE
jgi:hypothetical protein